MELAPGTLGCKPDADYNLVRLMLTHDLVLLSIPLVAFVVVTHKSTGPAAFILGFLMPLTAVPGLPYRYVVIARLLLTAVIFLRCRRDEPNLAVRQAQRMLLTIAALGMLVAGFAVFRSDHGALSVAGSMVESVAVAWVLVSRSGTLAPLGAGFVGGASLSAAFAVYQWLHHVDGGGGVVARYVGLSSSSTRVAYEYAIAIILVAVAARGKGIFLFVRGGLVALLLTALAVSGGRGGLVALALGLLVVSKAVGRAAERARAALVILLIALVAVLEAGVKISVFDRILGTAGTLQGANVGVTNGRASLWSDAVGAIGDHPFSGIGIDTFTAKFGNMPHASPVYFGVAAGGVGLVLASVVVFQVWRLALRNFPTAARAASVAAGLLGVLAVRSVLEPTTPLVGMEEVSLLAICIRAVHEGRNAAAQEPAESVEALTAS